MSSPNIHHLNFIVRDLAKATARFEEVLGLAPFEVVDHPPRGAKVARSRMGETWLVLVCPYDAESVPGRFLEKNGEGFFLLSASMKDLDGYLQQLESSGLTPIDTEARRGILDWRVADIAEIHGVLLQATDDK